jgi:DNA (cytosine-5)-methyltransferase 1
VLFHSDITMFEEFAGLGGTTWGATRVPWVRLIAAANHKKTAIESHEANFPDAEHFHADITKLDIANMPYATIFGGSPVCPPFTTASGVTWDFDKKNAQGALFDRADNSPQAIKLREKYQRGRLLMHEPIRYLRAMLERHGKPVLGGVIENVVQARQWREWDAWIAEFKKLGYHVKAIAFNSMHADRTRSPRAPQSRDRLYLMFWHTSLGRRPDFDKWLRPQAYCPKCDRTVNAVQVFKKAGNDMGRWGRHGQYLYRCPTVTCRGEEVFPSVLPALSAIDPSMPGVRIGDRAKLGMPDLVDATIARIKAGIRKYWAPLLVPSGGTWRENAQPLSAPVPARTTSDCDGVAFPAFSLPPFITPMRGGGDKERARSVDEPVHTVTAGGNHHGLAMPPLVMRNFTARPGAEGSMTTPATEPVRALTTSGNQSLLWSNALMVPYYGTADSAQPATAPVGALTTRDRYGVLTPTDLDTLTAEIDLDDVRFRMLTPAEIGRCMGFPDDYKMLAATREQQIDLYGNAVTPTVAELLYSALVECIAGEELPRNGYALAG